MAKTKNEVELEIRVKAIEDVLKEIERTVPIVNMPDINYYKLKHYNEMKAKHPDLRIEFPG